MAKGNQPHNDQSGRSGFQTKRRASADSTSGTSFHVHKRNKSELPVNTEVKEEKDSKEQNHFKPVHNSLGLHKQMTVLNLALLA